MTDSGMNTLLLTNIRQYAGFDFAGKKRIVLYFTVSDANVVVFVSIVVIAPSNKEVVV